MVQTIGQICDLFFQRLNLLRMFGFQHDKVAFAEGELPDILLCHPSDLPPNDGLHTRFKCSHSFADLFMCVVRQRGVLGLFFVPRCKVVFPDPANPGVVALAAKGFVDVRGGDLPAEFGRQGSTSFDDLFIGIEGGARHVILLCL
ncbi:hypothetical protein [Phycobacter sp. K97]|uniref:hypothetical protein n=1 Tax=Phycobacter sedimenti TaxID=3133977 RepID=UPI00311E4B56